MRRHHISALLAAILLAAPTSALAQSAGDNQYVDPFTRPEKPKQTAQTPARAGPVPPAAPAPTPLQASEATGGAAAQDSAATGVRDGEQLPRTGPRVEITAALGLLLTLSGAVLLLLPGVRRSNPR